MRSGAWRGALLAVCVSAACSGKTDDSGGSVDAAAHDEGAPPDGPARDDSPAAQDAAPDAPAEGGIPPGDCAGSAPPPPSAQRSVSLAMTGVDFGDVTLSDWKTIGFDLDGKCTTRNSTDVCTLYAGASKTTQADGQSGIDNSWGENMCPILETTSGTGSCSAKIAEVDLVTDAAGSGTMAFQAGGTWLVFPVRDAYVASSGGAGALGAVAPTQGVVDAFHKVAGSISSSLCSGSGWDSVKQQLEQNSDILSDGSNSAGPACDGISIGMKFSGSSAFGGSFPSVPDPCKD